MQDILDSPFDVSSELAMRVFCANKKADLTEDVAHKITNEQCLQSESLLFACAKSKKQILQLIGTYVFTRVRGHGFAHFLSISWYHWKSLSIFIQISS